ncbi:hypothetical protein LSAT2_027028 [Lamellibrachia satsuma]|nr:hypothetical protein LSAT2_027028 [Lamellibrachia satsuma]
MKGFNKEDVRMFFGQYRKLLVNGGFVPTRIYNCDETWFTTVASEDDDEWPCLVYGEPFRSSRSGESWIQCQICHQIGRITTVPRVADFMFATIASLSELVAVLMSVLALKRLSQQDQTCQQHMPDRCAHAQAATLVIIAAFSLGEKCDRRRGQVESRSTLNCRKSILIARAGQLQQFHPAFRKTLTLRCTSMGGQHSGGLSSSTAESLKRKTYFSADELRQWYKKFKHDYPDGVIRQQDFVNTYCQMCSQGDARAFAEHLFRGYDTDGDGAIDFQEFMCTLSISAKGSPEERLAWAFNMYDSNGDGCLSMNEAVDIISATQRMRGEHSREAAEDIAQQIFVTMDKDRNTVLSKEEFIRGAQNSPAVMELLQSKAT